jgi:hypothetical protein
MNATQQSPGGFEERLLAELRRVVAEGPGPAAAQPSPARPTPLWRRRPLAVAGGLAAIAAAATIAGLSLGGHRSAAWAVTSNANGTVTVKISSLSDAAGLERKLAAAGVPALVQYLPAGKACAGAQGSGAASSPPADRHGTVTDERGLSEAPPGASDRGLDQAGAPAAGGPNGAPVQAAGQMGMRTDQDGGVEFTIDPSASRGQTLVITSQTLHAAGPSVDGAALRVEYVKGKARPCKVVDAPE